MFLLRFSPIMSLNFKSSLQAPRRLYFSPQHMLHHRQSAVIPHRASHFFQVVYEVENYHQFLPWCSNAVINTRQDAWKFDAELFVNFKIYSDSYISRVRCDLVDREMDQYKIISESNDMSAVKRLRSTWAITAVSTNSCRVDYDIDFEFKKGAYQALAQIFLNTLVHTINNSFIDRVKSLERSNYFAKHPLKFPTNNNNLINTNNNTNQLASKTTIFTAASATTTTSSSNTIQTGSKSSENPTTSTTDAKQQQQTQSEKVAPQIKILSGNNHIESEATNQIINPTNPSTNEIKKQPVTNPNYANYINQREQQMIEYIKTTLVSVGILNLTDSNNFLKSILSNVENRETAVNAYKFFIMDKAFINLTDEEANWKFVLALRSIALIK